MTIGFGASAAIAGYVWDEKRAIKMWCHVKKDFVLYKFKAHERQTCGARPDHHFTILLCHLEQIVSPGCIPLAVETYGNWGKEAHDMFSRLASYLAIHQTSPKSAVVTKLYGRLNIALAVGQYHFQGYRETSKLEAGLVWARSLVVVVHLLLASLGCDVALGQTSPTRRFSNQTCSTGPTCPYNAPFPSVTVTTDATTRYIQTTGCPPYTNPGWITPNGACMVTVTVSVPLKPAFALTPSLLDNPVPALGKLGVFASNASGIMQYVDPKAPSNYVDAVQSEGQSTDACAGHGGPGGNYHIHSGLGINTTLREWHADFRPTRLATTPCC
eukprot:Em0090g4a